MLFSSLFVILHLQFHSFSIYFDIAIPRPSLKLYIILCIKFNVNFILSWESC